MKLGDQKRAVCKGLAGTFLRRHPGWHRTQDIAAGIGMSHEAGANDDIRYLRDALYNLELSGVIEHQSRQNGHRWRFPSAADIRDEMNEVAAASTSWPDSARLRGAPR